MHISSLAYTVTPSISHIVVWGLILTIVPWAFGADQKVYRLEDILVKKTDRSGQEQPALSPEAIDYFLDRIAVHAKEYPTKFDSEDQRTTIEHELKSLILALDMATENQPSNKDLLWRAGFAWSMAYNLDLPHSGEKTDHYFRRLLSLDQNHPQGNFFYGAHLAGMEAKQRESIPYLGKAAEMGFDDAVFMLGFVHLFLGENKRALEYFHRFLEAHPGNERTQQMIDTIKAGKVNRVVK